VLQHLQGQVGSGHVDGHAIPPARLVRRGAAAQLQALRILLLVRLRQVGQPCHRRRRLLLLLLL
jgi:hypothetical protein